MIGIVRPLLAGWSDPDFLDHLIGRDNALGVCHGKTEAIQCGVQAAGIAES